MWSAVASRIAGLKQAVEAAKKVAPEMIEIYGDDVWQTLAALESKALQDKKDYRILLLAPGEGVRARFKEA